MAREAGKQELYDVHGCMMSMTRETEKQELGAVDSVYIQEGGPE